MCFLSWVHAVEPNVVKILFSFDSFDYFMINHLIEEKKVVYKKQKSVSHLYEKMHCLLRKGCTVFTNTFNCKLTCSAVSKEILSPPPRIFITPFFVQFIFKYEGKK